MIKDALDAGLIAAHDPFHGGSAGTRDRSPAARKLLDPQAVESCARENANEIWV
jgi:hypothetical protein